MSKDYLIVEGLFGKSFWKVIVSEHKIFTVNFGLYFLFFLITIISPKILIFLEALVECANFMLKKLLNS